MKNIRVFLGGTCNESTWREELISKFNDTVDYFNPVVKDWDEKAYKKELYEREKCDICLYTITPRMTGTYSIAEVVDDSNKRYEKTVLCILDKDDTKSFDEGQLRSLKRVGELVSNNGGKVFYSLEDVAKYLNSYREANKPLLAFFDTEFSGLKKDCELLSIGIKLSNGKSFYAEISDYDRTYIEPWIKENVISKLYFNDKASHLEESDGNIKMKSNKIGVRAKLRLWLQQYKDCGVQFVSDCITYDHMLLIDIVSGHALSMPTFISPYCHDINQDIMRYYKISQREAFDKSRTEICNRNGSVDVHNSLVDAEMIKDIYYKLNA